MLCKRKKISPANTSSMKIKVYPCRFPLRWWMACPCGFLLHVNSTFNLCKNCNISFFLRHPWHAILQPCIRAGRKWKFSLLQWYLYVEKSEKNKKNHCEMFFALSLTVYSNFAFLFFHWKYIGKTVNLDDFWENGEKLLNCRCLSDFPSQKI